jgi:hypothetical protein
MMRGRAGQVVLAVVVIGCGLIAWRIFAGGEEAAIHRRLAALVDRVNSPAGEGLGAVSHAADLGNYFTDDVVIDLGAGTSPIQGRMMLVGMAARLQPRLAVYRLSLDDINVELDDAEATAQVQLTASFTTRSAATGEDSVDAREFALVMRSESGTWRIARVTSVETLR